MNNHKKAIERAEKLILRLAERLNDLGETAASVEALSAVRCLRRGKMRVRCTCGHTHNRKGDA